MARNYFHGSSSGSVVVPNEELAVNSKQRLNWTPPLHDIFIKAIQKLGGPIEAKPTAVKQQMERMGATGITLRHVKSHLQKYRSTYKAFQLANAASAGSTQNRNNQIPPPPPLANTAWEATADNDDIELEYLIQSPRMEPLPLDSDWEMTVDAANYYDNQSAIQIVPNGSFLNQDYSISLLPKEEDYRNTMMIDTRQVHGSMPNSDQYLNSFLGQRNDNLNILKLFGL